MKRLPEKRLPEKLVMAAIILSCGIVVSHLDSSPATHNKRGSADSARNWHAVPTTVAAARPPYRFAH